MVNAGCDRQVRPIETSNDIRILHFLDMPRMHSPGSDTQDYESSDVEEWEVGDEDAVQEAHEEQEEGAAVTGATTTDLVVGNVTGAGGTKVKKRKRVNEVAKEEVSEEEKEVFEVEEEEEEEEKEEKEEGETDATDATGNCFVLQAINNVVATLFRAYLFLKPILQMDPQCIPRYLAKANQWVRALLRSKNGADVIYLLSHEQDKEFHVMRCSVNQTSEQALVCIVHEVLLNCAQHPLPQPLDATATDYNRFYLQYCRSVGPDRDALLDVAHLRWATSRGGDRVVRMVTDNTPVNMRPTRSVFPMRLMGSPPHKATARLADSPPATDKDGLESLKLRQAIWVTNCFDLLQGLCPLNDDVMLIVATYVLEYEITVTISSDCVHLKQLAYLQGERKLLVGPSTDICQVIYTFLSLPVCLPKRFHRSIRVVSNDGETERDLLVGQPLFPTNCKYTSDVSGIHLVLSAKLKYSHVCVICKKGFGCIPLEYINVFPPADNERGCQCHRRRSLFGHDTIWYCGNVCYLNDTLNNGIL